MQNKLRLIDDKCDRYDPLNLTIKDYIARNLGNILKY